MPCIYYLCLVLIVYSAWIRHYTDKKENKIFLIYKQIQMESGAKSYMRKGFRIYEEMRKIFTIYEEALVI